MTDTQTGYAPVNGLEMYYEVHGEGEPLVVLHGAYMTVDAMGEIVPMLAETRKVIAVELQAHGRTADIERPITYEQMADDVAAFIEHLGIEKADLFANRRPASGDGEEARGRLGVVHERRRAS
jgi:pimeloyl-ACP methyl ester carboxylesterase